MDCLVGIGKIGDGEWLLGLDSDIKGGSSIMSRGTQTTSEGSETEISSLEENYSSLDLIESKLLG